MHSTPSVTAAHATSAVGSPAGGAAIILARGYGGWAPEKVGSFTGLVLNVENMRATCEELRERGVRFDLEPEQQPWGMQAVIKDPDGNTFVLRSFEGAET